MDKLGQIFKNKYVVSMLLALVVGLIINNAINAFKKSTEPQYALDITYHSATRFNYSEEKDTLELASCMTGMEVRMQYNKDTLIFSGQGLAFGYKPRMFVDSATLLATDIKNNPFYFRRVMGEKRESIWFSQGGVLNVFSTDNKCFEFEE